MRCLHRNALLLVAVALFGGAALCKADDDPASSQQPPRRLLTLLLPLDAPDFAPPAGAVLSGCKAALSLFAENPSLEVQRSDASTTSILAAYDAATSRGAGVIIGPMTRSGVSALADRGEVQTLTLALNSPEGNKPMPPNLVTFGLSVESEARQIARLAFAESLRSAVLVQSATPLAKRAAQAFAETWQALGGKLLDVHEFGPPAELVRLKQRLSRSDADLIFLSAGPEQGRSVRPYLNNQIPVFATSLINDGRADPRANVDLNGIRFVEIPWLAQPDDLGVMVYPRPESLEPDLQRFYALGIDACRIANEFLARRMQVNLEGVTGHLSLKAGGHIQREALLSVFRDGAGVALEAR